MTLPPEKIGDKGQRYEVHCTGYPKGGDNVIGWAATIDGAVKMSLAILKAPSAQRAKIIDRESGLVVGRSANGPRMGSDD